MALLEIDNLSATYGGVPALKQLSFRVEDGECIALLGPSGCGKTTTLRAIAGFVQPGGGDIRIGGRSVLGMPPHRRNVGLVFQDYALFPHMSVAGNVAYGLTRRGVARAETAERVADALRMVRLDAFGARFPGSLSGGQRQRVALARAIVVHPDILLLDEPLGALDRKLRDEMQFELRDLQARLSLTCIIVTHDQEEALSLASRVAVMFEGEIAEIGPPAALYHRPGSARTMDFLGACCSFVATAGAAGRYVTSEGLNLAGPDGIEAGRAVRLGIRPERIVLSHLPPRPGSNAVAGTVAQVVFKGPVADVYVAHAGPMMRAQVPTRTAEGGLTPGTAVWACFDPSDVLVFHSDG